MPNDTDDQEIDLTIPEDVVDDSGAPTEAELERLTPEERAALEDEDEDEGDEGAEDDPEAKSGDDDDSGDEGEADPAGADQPPPDDDGGKSGSGAVEATGAAEDDPAFPDIPDTSELASRIETLKGELKAAREKFDDGELSGEELDAEVTRVSEAMGDARADLREAQKAEEKVVAAWNTTVQTFREANGEVFSEQHVQGFDREVRAISADPALADLSGKAILNLALKRYAVTAEALGKPLSSAPAPAPKGGEKKARDPLNSPLGEVPQTLARTPAAAAPAVSDGKMGQLAEMFENPDLSPTDLERILSRMSPEEREAFASMDN